MSQGSMIEFSSRSEILLPTIVNTLSQFFFINTVRFLLLKVQIGAETSRPLKLE